MHEKPSLLTVKSESYDRSTVVANPRNLFAVYAHGQRVRPSGGVRDSAARAIKTIRDGEPNVTVTSRIALPLAINAHAVRLSPHPVFVRFHRAVSAIRYGRLRWSLIWFVANKAYCDFCQGDIESARA